MEETVIQEKQLGLREREEMEREVCYGPLCEEEGVEVLRGPGDYGWK